MARPLRIEFDGAFYHITSRGNSRNNIFFENNDYLMFLDENQRGQVALFIMLKVRFFISSQFTAGDKIPRPPRVEYDNAFYLVMNLARVRQTIFHGDIYYHYQTFLATLDEACARFKCVVHAYCLMSNHYHLLIETPGAN
jgi:REP element-mobilizing transposase RayT